MKKKYDKKALCALDSILESESVDIKYNKLKYNYYGGNKQLIEIVDIIQESRFEKEHI